MSTDREIIGRHLGFRTRTVNMLLRGGTVDYVEDVGWIKVDGRYPITTMAQLASCTLREVLRIRGAGKHTLFDCERVLRAHGYTAETSQLIKLLEDL